MAAVEQLLRRLSDLRAQRERLLEQLRDVKKNIDGYGVQLKTGRIRQVQYDALTTPLWEEYHDLEERIRKIDAEVSSLEKTLSIARSQPTVTPTATPTATPADTATKTQVSQEPPPPKTTAPGPPPGYMRYEAPGLEEAVGRVEGRLADFGNLRLTTPSAGVASPLESAFRGFLDALGIGVDALVRAVGSPADPLKAAQYAASMMVSGLTSYALLSTVGIIAEVASLGQIEGVTATIHEAFRNLGFSEIVNLATALPFRVGVETPARQYWMSVFRPSLPSPEDLKTWFLRGLASKEEVYAVMARHGFKDVDIARTMESWWVIPSVSDLITFVVREVITPEEFTRWAARQGLSEYWSKCYWEAHWILPSFSDLREAFWRGVITLDEFKRYLVWHDYKPEPRPGIAKSDVDIVSALAFKPPGRIDARWMLRWGLIDEGELKRLALAEGVSPEWVDRVARAEWMNILSDERTGLRSVYVRQFKLGLIDEPALRVKLRSCYYTDAEVDWIVQRAKVEYELEELELSISALKEAYRKDLLTPEEFLSELVRLGVAEKRARLIVEAESYRKLPRPRY